MWKFVLLLVTAMLLFGCSSTPEEPIVEEPAEEPIVEEPAVEEPIVVEPPMAERMGAVTLKAELSSFSPARGVKQGFIVNGRKDQPFDSWVFSVTDSEEKSVYSEKGEGMPPRQFFWAGMTGKQSSAEGIYTGILSLVYEDESSRAVKSNPFLLDLTKPVPSFTVKGEPFTPDGNGKGDELSITVNAKDASPIQEWLFEIRSMDGTVLNSFTGTQPLPHTVIWNGKTNGSNLESGMDYRIYGVVRDAAGNEGTAQKDFFVGALTTMHNGSPIIVVPTIQFPPNIATLDETTQAQFDLTVTRVARILKKSPDMRILIIGQANATRFKNNRPDPVEQKNLLIPLSIQRAELVLNGLLDRGIARNRLVFEGVGASDPAVSFADADHRGMNRRILFYVLD